MLFEITEQMEERIKEWDTCTAMDVTGAKFAFTFIPSGIGTFIEVHCDVCNRKLLLSGLE